MRCTYMCCIITMMLCSLLWVVLLHSYINSESTELRRDNVIIAAIDLKRQREQYQCHGVHQNSVSSIHTILTAFVMPIILAAVNDHRCCQELTVVREQENQIIVCHGFSSVSYIQKVEHHQELDDEESFHLAHSFLDFLVICEA